ncbi:MAG: glycoside hydrolase family 97 N-terminal domain-containing protein [Phycisphaerae bacterium]|nr:glycoside hydrolase family 97 N-terminal domain-containing protein [Phycisphaerae bacterium]
MYYKASSRWRDVLMPLFRAILVSVVVELSGFAAGAVRAEHSVESPDGNVAITFDIGQERGDLIYSVAFDGRPVIVNSRLGLALKDAASLETGFEISNVSASSHDSTYSLIYAERKTIRDHYNQLIVDLKESNTPYRKLRLTFRAYNEGAALRYTVPEQNALKSFVISAEKTQFCFAADHAAYATHSAQGQYSKVPLSKLTKDCERPLTIQINDILYAAVAEAGLVDYARMRLSPGQGQAHTVVSSLASEVDAATPLTTPWRVVMFGRTPGELLERNYLILNLNERCAIKDTSWIKPGKVIREVTLTTAGGMACVDFAAEHNLQYVEFDAGWYGHEYSDESDARTISVDPKRSKGPLDLHGVIEYAKQRDIGIILYVNRRALERQLDEILPLYEKWGIKGVKYGFVRVGPHQWTTWLHEAVRKAAEHHLMVDVHDEYRPTGYSRTYPNLMTQEGIAGDETKPSNSLTLTILFTRMLAGAADNTICYYDRRVDENASHAYQLAKSVCFYSPWQFLYWYDRPGRSPSRRAGSGAGGSHNVIGDEPELEFFDYVPTVWDDTKVIHGEIGACAVLARRSDESWFIGCMNGDTARTLDVPLDFLDKDRTYVAHIYADDPTISTRTHVKISRWLVDSATVLKAELPLRGGQAIRICPATADDLKTHQNYENVKIKERERLRSSPKESVAHIRAVQDDLFRIGSGSQNPPQSFLGGMAFEDPALDATVNRLLGLFLSLAHSL